MKAALKIEAIGDNVDQELAFWSTLTNSLAPGLGDLTFGTTSGRPKKRYWVAEITGLDPVYKYAREFLRPQKDYRKANRKGSRGVHLWYILESGKIYEVKRPVSWSRHERFFCRVLDDGTIERIDEKQVNQWIADTSE